MIKITVTGLTTGKHTSRTFTVRQDEQRRQWLDTIKKVVMLTNTAVNITTEQL